MKIKFAPGTRVRLISTGEVGIVICGWADEVMETDYYVAFFGGNFPSGKPVRKPYVLRYAGMSLELCEETLRDR